MARPPVDCEVDFESLSGNSAAEVTAPPES